MVTDSLQLEGAQKMTTYVPNPVESSETNQASDEAAREQIQSRTMERRPRRGALVFVSGFMLGALATTVASIFGRGRRTPFVLGNRNVFVSLPFSGISMAEATSRSKGRGRRAGRFTRYSRVMARSAARGAASGMARGMVRGRSERRDKQRTR